MAAGGGNGFCRRKSALIGGGQCINSHRSIAGFDGYWIFGCSAALCSNALLTTGVVPLLTNQEVMTLRSRYSNFIFQPRSVSRRPSLAVWSLNGNWLIRRKG